MTSLGFFYLSPKKKKAAVLTNPVIYFIKIAPLFFYLQPPIFLDYHSFFFSCEVLHSNTLICQMTQSKREWSPFG